MAAIAGLTEHEDETERGGRKESEKDGRGASVAGG